MKDLRKLRYFISIEMTRLPMRLILNQRKYTLYLLKEIEKLGYRSIATLIEAKYKMGIKDDNYLTEEGKCKYQKLVGKLIYLTLTKYDIRYVVNVVSQFIHAPTNVSFIAIEKILCYLKKNLSKGLLYKTR